MGFPPIVSFADLIDWRRHSFNQHEAAAEIAWRESRSPSVNAILSRAADHAATPALRSAIVRKTP
jgi:hypothetical protein